MGIPNMGISNSSTLYPSLEKPAVVLETKPSWIGSITEVVAGLIICPRWAFASTGASNAKANRILTMLFAGIKKIEESDFIANRRSNRKGPVRIKLLIYTHVQQDLPDKILNFESR